MHTVYSAILLYNWYQAYALTKTDHIQSFHRQLKWGVGRSTDLYISSYSSFEIIGFFYYFKDDSDSIFDDEDKEATIFIEEKKIIAFEEFSSTKVYQKQTSSIMSRRLLS